MLHERSGLMPLEKVMLNAAEHGAMDIIEWLTTKFPFMSLHEEIGHITMNAINSAHQHAGCGAIALFLERNCPFLFPRQEQTRKDHQRMKCAETIIRRHRPQSSAQ